MYNRCSAFLPETFIHYNTKNQLPNSNALKNSFSNKGLLEVLAVICTIHVEGSNIFG